MFLPTVSIMIISFGVVFLFFLISMMNTKIRDLYDDNERLRSQLQVALTDKEYMHANFEYFSDQAKSEITELRSMLASRGVENASTVETTEEENNPDDFVIMRLK
jgi:hypothetical protein